MNAVDLIARFEGFEPRAYVCPAGVLTIGYGSTRDAAGRPIAAGATITPADARKLLARDMGAAEAALARLVKVPLTDGQRAALVSFVYNIGAGAFGGSTMLRRLNAGDYDGAGREFGRWTRGGGRALPGLVKRRAAERAVFEAELPHTR